MCSFRKIKFYMALFGAKGIASCLQLFSKSATSLPGMIALKADKGFLAGTPDYCSKKIITITGTNGKTTTSGLFANILKTDNQNVIHNHKGANMPQGIASALALGINPFKKEDYFVLENDEAYLSKVYDSIKADYLLVTNLFRDQLDRYGELETTAKKIRNAIDKNPDLTVVLNADDPMLHSLYTKNTITFGFEDIEFVGVSETSNAPKENVYCKCGKALNYTKNFYAHIGHYSCDCGYTRQKPDICAKAKIYPDKTELKVSFENSTYDFVCNVPGLYNSYNALGAISLALLVGVNPTVIQKSFDEYKSVFGRAEKLKIKGKNVFVQLIKNPVGASEVIRTIAGDDNSNLLVIINDDYADGRDVSWLWDADFDALSAYKNQIFVSGKRACDMALRLKYTNYDYNRILIESDIESAINKALSSLENGQTLHILPTYTALLYMQELLKKL